MQRYNAVVDLENNWIWIKYPEVICKFDLPMLGAAVINPKYWEDAELHQESVEITLQEILKGGNPPRVSEW